MLLFLRSLTQGDLHAIKQVLSFNPHCCCPGLGRCSSQPDSFRSFLTGDRAMSRRDPGGSLWLLPQSMASLQHPHSRLQQAGAQSLEALFRSLSLPPPDLRFFLFIVTSGIFQAGGKIYHVYACTTQLFHSIMCCRDRWSETAFKVLV